VPVVRPGWRPSLSVMAPPGPPRPDGSEKPAEVAWQAPCEARSVSTSSPARPPHALPPARSLWRSERRRRVMAAAAHGRLQWTRRPISTFEHEHRNHGKIIGVDSKHAHEGSGEHAGGTGRHPNWALPSVQRGPGGGPGAGGGGMPPDAPRQ
jgi:hypothetical protein